LPILLDTNVYVFAMRSDEGAEFFRRRFRPLVFQTHVSSIVIEELYAGALDAGAMRLVERYVGALERAGRVITPTADEWKEWIGVPGMTYQVAINAKTDRAR
jgi:predicted nucleic acid-binding protein